MAYKAAVLLTFSVFTTTLLVLCYNLPFSQPFRRMHSYSSLFAQVEQATEMRTQAAKEYFNRVDSLSSRSLYDERLKQGNVTFAVGIITLKRTRDSEKHDSFGYVYQSASLLDHVMKHYAIFNNSVPFVCNIDAFPEKHFDAVHLKQFMPYSERYGENSFKFPPLEIPTSGKLFTELTRHDSKYQKESYDYSFCLLTAAKLRPQYVILVEDDTIPHTDFPAVLDHIINFRLKHFHDSSHKNNFAFLKFYYPAKWEGFAFEFSEMLDLLCWSIVGATVLCLIILSISYRFRWNYNAYKVSVLSFLLSLVFCWMIGRQNVIEARRLSKHFYRLQTSHGCCTQAMLYRTQVVNSLSSYLLLQGASTHKDLAIWDFAEEYSLPTLQVEPSLFFHTGLHTTLDQKQKHPEEFIFHIQ